MSGTRPRHFGGSGPGWRERRGRFLAGACTVGAHAIIFAALFWPRSTPPPKHVPPPPPSLEVSLLDQPSPKAPEPPTPDMLEPTAPQINLRLPRVTPRVSVLSPAYTDDMSDLLSESQVAGAAVAGEGGGGNCDLARAVQQALRRDPMVRAAVEDAHRTGKAVMLWNGDWVRSGAQDGKGLSAVREAIQWEVAFAPEACRNIRMHGLVLLSLADGATRFAVGTGEWRWSDLLGVHG